MAGGEVQLVALTKRFDDVAAVAGIDLHIPSGEFFSILGPSGCGKTTTLRLVAGFEEPTSGAILLDGEDVARKPPHKRNVNTVFQSYALFPFLTVTDNVAVRPPLPGRHQGREGRTGGRGPGAGTAPGLRQAAPRPALRGPAATGRPGPRPGAQPGRACCSTSRSARSTPSSGAPCRWS